MTDVSWTSAASRIERARRLQGCGFDCFESAASPTAEELRYAEYEFQLYSLHAKWLAQRVGKVVGRAASQQVCIDLQALTADLLLGEPWSAGWEACLDRWDKSSDAGGPYLCPVLIDRVEKPADYSRFPNEHDAVPASERENIWAVGDDDHTRFFYARDFSGMFSFDLSERGDLAYRATADYTPPDWIAHQDPLFERRLFMQVKADGELEGVAVQPWRACEFLPDLLGRDAARIRTDAQWRSLYRVIRAASDIECYGYFDLLQGYDNVNLSVPLFHYTLASTGKNKALTAELAGLLIWLERFDGPLSEHHANRLSERLAAAGLSAFRLNPEHPPAKDTYIERHWVDDKRWGQRYDAGSGDSTKDGARVTGSVSIGPGVVNSAADMAFLRKPHFHYRTTMLLRTVPALRIALWKLAVHRVRGLAWTPLSAVVPNVPSGLAGRRVGQVLTSELALAIITRFHIWEPNNLRSRVGSVIARVWKEVSSDTTLTDTERQQKFELSFCQSYFVENIERSSSTWRDRIDGSNLNVLPAWPGAKDQGFKPRLRQTHLTGTGKAQLSDEQPPRLSWLPWSSPFWKTTPGPLAEFLDPVAHLDRDLDFAADGHPAVPTRYLAIEAQQKFGALGTQLALPAAFSKVGADVLTAQRVRETLAVRLARHVLVKDQLVANPQPLDRRLHGDGTQFWARRHVREMEETQTASALRCGSSTVPPAPQAALWALDGVASGSTVYAFDWRSGPPGVDGGADAFATVGPAVEIASKGDRFRVDDPTTFGTFISLLEQKTFKAFALALKQGIGISHVDNFVVEPGSSAWTITLAGLRQSCPVSGSGSAKPSEWGLLIEYLAWRHAQRSPDHDGWYGGPFDVLRGLGFDAWLPQPESAEKAFLRQPWPAIARGTAPAKGKLASGPLDGLTLCSVPHLWNAPRPLDGSSSAQITAAVLNWPALYRLRRMFQDSQQARRAVYDLWRMGARATLSLSLSALRTVFDKQVPIAFQMFQSAESVAMLACWRYLDSAGLVQALQRDSGPIAVAAKAWFGGDATRKKFENWTSQDEYAFVWQVVVPAIKDQKIRDALVAFRPLLPIPPRQHLHSLGEVMDLEGLDSVAAPVPQVDYQAVLLRQPTAAVGLGLLTAPAPMSTPSPESAVAAATEDVHALHGPAEALAADQFWVGGIVPVLKVGDEFKAVPLMLPEPALVRLFQGPTETVQVSTLWAPGGVAEKVDFAALDITEPFTIEADISSWLGELALGVSLTLLASVSSPSPSTFVLSLGLRLISPWLHKPLEWSRRVVDISGIALNAIGGGHEVVWRFPLSELGDSGALPIRLESHAAIELALGMDNGTVTSRFKVSASKLGISLGSPVASLRLHADGAPLSFEADLLNGSAHVTYPDAFSAYLALELAALPPAVGEAARIVPTEDQHAGHRVPPFDILLARFASTAAGAAAPGARTEIDLSDLTQPRVPAWLFDSGAADYNSRPRCRLLDIAGQWLEGVADAAGAVMSAIRSPAISRVADHLKLELPIQIQVSGMQATANLSARCAVDAQGFLQLRGDSFACGLSAVHLVMEVTTPFLDMGSVARIELPPRLEAVLTLDGSDPGTCLRLLIPVDGPHPAVAVPASGGIRFDVSELGLGSGGLTLAATVSKDVVRLDLPVLDRELAVQEPQDGIGEFRIVRGRLVSASLQAKVKLKVFDDAEGVLTMRIAQDRAGLTIMAELDVGVAKTFHLRALYLQVIVASINLSLSYGSDGRWKAKGGLTGSIKFAPEGPMLGRLEEYRSLFDGTSVHFENMDLAQLGESPITVMVTPRTFDVGSMFAVTWRGFVLQRPGDLQAFMGLRLLGDITFKQRLPKMRVALTLGDITIRQLRADSLIPKIAISSIGVDIGMSGGFSFKGRVTEFDDAHEYGFGGEVELRSEAFPAAQAMIKLTRLKEAPSLPSIAVYAAMDRNDSLGYGFFLRKVGIGVGIRQGLRGFSDEPGKPTADTIAARVERTLQDPRGLPYPAHLSSWQALAPGQRPECVLVAYMLVTFGLLKPDVDHPLAASAVLAIDDNLDIIVGLNGWFVTSPDNTGDEAYIARPAIKGALALSPREQVLYGRFMTLPNSKFGDSANLNPMMRMLQTALDAVRLSVTMYADPRGALIEVGWPRSARFDLQLGPARGWAEAGFRFGFYRGTQVVGLNLAVQAEVSGGFSQDLGFANVSLSVLARFELQATFAGAVTTAGQYYVLAEVMLSALLEISARAYKRIRISGWGFSFTVTLFDVSVTLAISATAVLQTAIVPSGLGFNGSVEVHIRIAGFGISARVRIGSSEGRIDEARQTIAALVPPIEQLIQAGTPPARVPTQPLALAADATEVSASTSTSAPAGLMAVVPSPAVPEHWRCHAVRVNDELRVVLFPDAEAARRIGYPPQAMAGSAPNPFVPRAHTLWLSPSAADAFNGVVGQAGAAVPPGSAGPVMLTLVEAANDVLLSHEWLLRQQPDAPRAVYAGDMLANVAVEVEEHAREIVDPRTLQPVAGDFDDPAVLADPTRRSTRFRKRYSADGAPTYDDHLRRMLETDRNDTGTAPGTTASGELLIQLMNMARDARVKPGTPVAGPSLDDKDYSPHLLASRLGLVLSFKWSESLEIQLATSGVTAILDPGSPPPVMFGLPINAAYWSCETTRRARFQIEPGYYFEGRGEIGLVWSVVRKSAQGVVCHEGPANHAGIGAFRVQRLKEDASGLAASEKVLVVPSWPRYTRGGITYYLRPQFQFLDNSLPQTGTANLFYQVEALADDGTGNTVIASQIIPVRYRAPSNAFSLVHGQAVLRLPPDAAGLAPATPEHFRVELLLNLDVDTRGMPDRAWKGTPDEIKRLARRIELYRHRVAPGVLGRYAQGHDGQISVSWTNEDRASGVALPDTDQMRQLTIADLDPHADRVEGLVWKLRPTTAPAVPPGTVVDTLPLCFSATMEIRTGSEQEDWDQLLGEGVRAAELHFRLKADAGDSTLPPELATVLLRCRIAVTRDTTAFISSVRLEAALSEGTEVAALERLPLSAATERPTEWLAPDSSSFRAEVAPRPFVAGARAEDIGLRLRGVINHERDADDHYGAVVGYRVWARDRLDGDRDPRAQALADFLVEPEALYRATPSTVTVRQLAGGTPGEPNWRFAESALRLAAPSGVAASTPNAGFGVCTLNGGNKASLHASLKVLMDALDDGVVTARCHADEPMWPAVSSGTDRLAELLVRHPAATDLYGWRLLEAVGASATVWVANDDDRFGLETWEPTLALHADTVVAVTFSRLRPGERPDKRELSLYGVRVFSRAMLEELLTIVASQDSVAHCLAQPSSQLAAALRLVAPPPHAGALDERDIPRAWTAYVEALLERADGFVRRPDENHPPCLCAPMWELGRIPASRGGQQLGSAPSAASTEGPKAEYPIVLPTLSGQVHVFHTMENGYARVLEVAVEVVRRYDLVESRAVRAAPASVAHTVPVVRTQPLEPERWAIAPDPETGALTALVAVPAAQRLVLYRSDLAARVQLIGQTVRLQRVVSAPASAGWNAVLEALGPEMDREAYEATWVFGEAPETPPLSDWALPTSTPGSTMHRGYDAYCFQDLPPFYAHGIHVVTQAGVRHSAESDAPADAPVMTEAMFTQRNGLTYPAPRLRWALVGDGETLSFEFALVRGVDALRPAVQAHWVARDQFWATQEAGEPTGTNVPVLQLPDLRARYSLVATGTAPGGPPLRVELAHVWHRDEHIDVKVLVGADGGAHEPQASLIQISEEKDRGRIGIACALDLTSVELAWLRTALGQDGADWHLTMEVQRDGVQYREERTTP